MAKPYWAGEPVPSYRARARRWRIERRIDLRHRSITPTKTLWCFRVDLEVAHVPRWAYEFAMKDFSISTQHIWVRSKKVAEQIAQYDHDKGGPGEIARTEWRRCNICGRILLNLEAERRRKQLESAMTGSQNPCGPNCLEKHWRDKGVNPNEGQGNAND